MRHPYRSIFSLLLALALLFSFLPVTDTSAATEGYLSYHVQDGKVRITWCDSSASGALVIPSSINGYPVIGISGDAFSGCNRLTEITIPEGVTSIGPHAFNRCTSLTRVTIPSSVSSIQKDAFHQCGSVSIQVNKNNPTYSVDAHNVLFNKDKSILIEALTELSEKYTVPDSVTSIGDYAFSECANLTGITIPDSVIRIGERAFANCTRLTTIALPNSVTSIGSYAFYNCSNLTTVTLPDNITSIGASGFRGCKSLKNITIPASLSSIENFLFSDCTSLRNLTIPDTVTSVGYSAFDGCSNLNYNRYDNGNYLGNKENPYYALIEIDDLRLTYFTVHPNTVRIAGGAFEWSNVIDITIPNQVRTIGFKAFASCDQLASITLSDGIISIEHSAFRGCLNLKRIIFLGKIPAFALYTGVENGTFDSVTAIAYYPQGNTSWREGIMTRYGGKIAWKPYGSNGTLKKVDGVWKYYEHGVHLPATTLVKFNGSWYYVKDGLLASNTTTLIKWNGSWYYIKNGKLASQTSTLVKYNGEWFYIVNGKVASSTTNLIKYNGEWFYIVKGKVASQTTTLIKYNGSWYYIYKGKVAAKTTTLVKYSGSWFYVKDGKVDFGYSGEIRFNGGHYTVKNGKVVQLHK